MQKINIICPTYREGAGARMRLIATYQLIQNVLGRENLRLCIIDSSTEALSVFRQDKIHYQNILYLHVPTKEKAIQRYATCLPKMMDFLITPEHKNFKKTKELVESWAYFIPWDDWYPRKATLLDHFLDERPSIGMKRNMAIAALEEVFGPGDVLCYADDDDLRKENYFDEMASLLQENSFVRIAKWLTCCFEEKKEPLLGINDMGFYQKANGFWVPDLTKAQELYNSRQIEGITNLIKDRYSKLITMALPPISYDGAIHVFKMAAWREGVEAFGGVLPVSLAEDIIFFMSLARHMGHQFKAKVIENKTFNFIRTAHANTSLVEWTKTIHYLDMPSWAQEVVSFSNRLLADEKLLISFEKRIKDLVND